MRIERVIFRGLRALRERDDRLVPPDGRDVTVCLRGLNGSGKTTYLEALAELWQWFSRCAKKRTFASAGGAVLLKEAELTAALVTGLPGPRARMWIAFGKLEALRRFAGDPDCAYSFGDDGVTWDDRVLSFWDSAIESARLGLSPQSLPPNVVYIEAENKYVPRLRADELTSPRAAPAYAPVARYLPTSRGPSHLEGLMRTLFLARRERWDVLAKYVTELRPELTLLDRFDESTQRPLLRLDTGEILTVDRLSAGERSLLINFCMLLRWLAPGGIVLLDEPELHQHISLMRGSLAVLEQIIRDEFDGQFILASHAPEVWDHFRRDGAIVDLGD